MRHDDWNQLNEMVIAAVSELLSSSGITTTYAGSVQEREKRWADTISIIGLGGDKLRGSVVLSVPTEVLVASHPAKGTSDDDLADWLAELANLLLGQIKRRVLTYGISFEMSTPITLSATALRFHKFKGLPMMHKFESAGGTILVMFEAIGEDGAQLAQVSDESVALDSGEVVLF